MDGILISYIQYWCVPPARPPTDSPPPSLHPPAQDLPYPPTINYDNNIHQQDSNCDSCFPPAFRSSNHTRSNTRVFSILESCANHTFIVYLYNCSAPRPHRAAIIRTIVPPLQFAYDCSAIAIGVIIWVVRCQRVWPSQRLMTCSSFSKTGVCGCDRINPLIFVFEINVYFRLQAILYSIWWVYKSFVLIQLCLKSLGFAFWQWR